MTLSRRRIRDAGRSAQIRFGEAGAAGIVEENPLLAAGPDSLDVKLTWAEDLEEDATRLTPPGDDVLVQRGDLRIEPIVIAQHLEDVFAKVGQSRQ